jgi:hypothetical protein
MKKAKFEKHNIVKNAENDPFSLRSGVCQCEVNRDATDDPEEKEYWEYQIYLLKSMKGVCNV